MELEWVILSFFTAIIAMVWMAEGLAGTVYPTLLDRRLPSAFVAAELP